VEFSVTATSEPDIWQWRFQIGANTISGKTRTRWQPAVFKCGLMPH